MDSSLKTLLRLTLAMQNS